MLLYIKKKNMVLNTSVVCSFFVRSGGGAHDVSARYPDGTTVELAVFRKKKDAVLLLGEIVEAMRTKQEFFEL